MKQPLKLKTDVVGLLVLRLSPEGSDSVIVMDLLEVN
jgi:hypothetical protein